MAGVISQARQGKPRLPTPEHRKGFWGLQSSSRCGAKESDTIHEGTKQSDRKEKEREREQKLIMREMSKVEDFDSVFH